MEAFDGLSALRNGLRTIASEQGHWAGIPMPLEGQRLVIEPRYPHAAELMRIGLAESEKQREAHDEAEYARAKIRNRFFSMRLRSEIIIWELDGRIEWGRVPGIHHFGLDLETLRSADAWGVEQESNAVHALAGLIRHRQFKQYLLTGMFLETSTASNVTYIFRRLKPTVALTMRPNNVFRNGTKDEVRILATLCLHPIGYYAGSWAGAMCPTDDVIAHLMMMRGDEAMFWRRANQTPPWRPEAGL